MEMPKNYAQTQAAGDFTPIELGGHYLVIKQVEESTSKKGKPMIIVSFDMAQNDKQANYFLTAFRNDIRPDKKWPSAGVSYVTTEDANGNCSKSFKGFTTSVEKSNPGFVIQWGPGFAACFKNKLVGGVFGEELSVYQKEEKGQQVLKESKQHKLRWFCSTDKVADARIPDPTETPEHKSWRESGGLTTAPADANGFMNIPDNLDQEELPFN